MIIEKIKKNPKGFLPFLAVFVIVICAFYQFTHESSFDYLYNSYHMTSTNKIGFFDVNFNFTKEQLEKINRMMLSKNAREYIECKGKGHSYRRSKRCSEYEDDQIEYHKCAERFLKNPLTYQCRLSTGNYDYFKFKHLDLSENQIEILRSYSEKFRRSYFKFFMPILIVLISGFLIWLFI